MAKLQSPVMLIIMDGFGLGDVQDPTNAVVQAKPKNITVLEELYPHTTLGASGEDVGLPDGQMGNSEVGHLNIGAGRIVYQELTRITKDAKEGTLFTKEVLQEVYAHGKEKQLHVLGLLSDGGVHSHIDHMKALIEGAKNAGVTKLFVHAFLDGRDVGPSTAKTYIDEMEAFMAQIGLGSIATISGRYYAMDRDNRWERVEKAYAAMVDGVGETAPTAVEALAAAYDRGETDEFVMPTVIGTEGQIEEGDAILFANFRPDRARQLTRALSDEAFTEFTRTKGFLAPFMATMTVYEEDLPVHVIYRKEKMTNTLGEVMSKAGYHQLRIAETEKYAHVTYFFNGGDEVPLEAEERILIPSPQVATYDLQPEMSAPEVTEALVENIRKGRHDMIIVNYANPDMVGHTGNFDAAVKAVQAVDHAVGTVVREMIAMGGHVLITADHGNCDKMVDHEKNIPYTAHTTNRVPLILVSEQYKDAKLMPGRLCDIAPTMLDLAHMEKPEEMTGHSLIEK